MIAKDRFDFENDRVEKTVQGDSTRLLENDYSTQQTKENECCSCPEGEKCCIGWKRDVIFFISGLFFTLAVGGLGFFIYLKVDGSSSGSTVQPHVPNAPTILSIIASSSSIFFTWTHNLTTIDPVHKFELILNYKSNKQIIQLEDLGLSYQANITGLLSGETYGIEIRGNNSIGLGPWASFQQLTKKTSLPPTPRELSLVTVKQEGTQAVFSVKPEGDGGSLLTQVQLQTAAENVFNCDINPYNRSSRTETYEEVKCTVSDLTQGATTFVSASLCNQAGCGGFTNQIECLFVADDTSLCTRPSPKPNPPTNVQVLNTDPLLLSWDPSKDSSGKPDETVTHYQIRLDDPWYGGGLAIVSIVESTSYTNTTILPGSTYNYQIRAITSDQQSEWTALENLKTKDKGTCGNEADIRQWRSNFPDLEKKSEKCGRRHIKDEAGCEKCLQDSLGLSLACGGCWYEEGMCTVDNCVRKCLTHHCQECWDKNCSPNFQSCSGMPTWTYPPVTS